MEHLVDQKLENASSDSDSPMSSPEESTIVIPSDWPSQQLIPEPSHMLSPQPTRFDAYPSAPSQRPPLEVDIVVEVVAGQDTARSTGSSTTQQALPVCSMLVLLPIVWLGYSTYLN